MNFDSRITYFFCLFCPAIVALVFVVVASQLFGAYAGQLKLIDSTLYVYSLERERERETVN